MRSSSIDAFVSRALACVLAACCALTVFAQAQPTRVTVVMLNGARVEGVLKSATATEFVLDVAGIEQKIPLASVSEVIVGKPPSSAPPIREAFAAFRKLQDELAKGNVNDSDYKSLVTTLQKSAGFATGTGEWADIRMAMNMALTQYNAAIADSAGRNERWMRAGHHLNWARELERDVERERDHLEDPTARPVKIGQRITGRLGAGDRQMTHDLDRNTEGAFHDLWTIDMRASGNLMIEMSSNTVTPHLMLVDANGEKLANERGQFSDVAVRQRVSAGTYRIWAGASTPRDVGSYTLHMTVQP